MNTLFSRL